MDGELKKLKIEGFKSIKYTKRDGVFYVMFNPTSYSRAYQIEYHDAQAPGTTASAQKFRRIRPADFRLEFTIDGTGASGQSLTGERGSENDANVSRQVQRFLSLTSTYQGDIHSPRYLRVSWGSFTFDCVLKSVEVTYTLFKPDGFPLRAKISATFSETVDDVKRVAAADPNSPDLTHHRTVKKGDNLPLMVSDIYGDPRYYAEVARVNNLSSFRNLEVGTILRFPPLKQQESP